MRIIFLLLFACLCMPRVLAQTGTEFEQLVAAYGLNEGVKDLSGEKKFTMPEPRLAFVNLKGFTIMPTTKRDVKAAWMEVYDGDGRYFKKRVKVAAQGNYTLKFPKKNFSCQFCDNDGEEDEEVDISFGDWVAQDGFHFKACYTDYFRGIGEIGYKVFDRIAASPTPYWERGGYVHESQARCYPDGFPCAVYVEGKFYGLFAWQLKKSRKNMNMKKHVAEHIHLDGSLQNSTLFRGKVRWSQFEVRNPKDLYSANGSVYNGNSPLELMDDSCANYRRDTDSEEVKEAKERTVQVKRYIEQMSRYWDELNEMEEAGATKWEMKEAIEQRYDIESLLDYCVFFHLSANCDGTLKNWQWFTYDGQKWFVTPYDLDQTFGINLYGVVRPARLPMESLTSGPFYWIDKYYQNDIRAHYAKLRESGAIDAEAICGIARDWCERIGDSFYALEQAHWPNSPCFKEALCHEGWTVYDDWSSYATTPNYNSMKKYEAGDVVKLEGRLWQATQTMTGVTPYLRNSNLDSLQRFCDWVDSRINLLDAYWGYGPDGIAEIHPDNSFSATTEGAFSAVPDDGTAPHSPTPSRQLVAIYSLSGTRIPSPLPGINLFKYSDGTVRKVRVR